MIYWIQLATSWHADGTPRPHRTKFLTAVQEGDPLAIALLAAAMIAVVGPALYRAIYKR
jgi:hypothetical protein